MAVRDSAVFPRTKGTPGVSGVVAMLAAYFASTLRARLGNDGTLQVPRPGFEPGTPRSKRGMMVHFTIGVIPSPCPLPEAGRGSKEAEGKGVEPSSPFG